MKMQPGSKIFGLYDPLTRTTYWPRGHCISDLEKALGRGPAFMRRDLTETITVDETTGGKKGSKLARFSLIPPEALWALAEHYGKGSLKYADRNWEKGYKWSLTVDALERHLTAVKMGEWLDPETGSAHIIAVAWHAFALFVFKVRGLGTNDLHEGLNK